MKKRFTITLDEQIVKNAKKIAIDRGMSFSSFIEMLLEREVNISNKIPYFKSNNEIDIKELLRSSRC